jgi:outer membrane autotransporter protein
LDRAKNLAVTSPINVGSLYNSPQAQQFREDHKNIIINTINSISSSGVPKESIDTTIIKSLPYLDNDQYQEVVLRVDRVHDINTRGYLLSKLKQLGESEVRELTGVYASIYNTAPPEVLGEAVALLDRSQGRLNLVDSTIKKGTQPLSNLSTIYEPASYENLASETIYKTEQPKPPISYKNTSKQKLPIPLFRSAELDKKLDYLDLEDKLLEVEEARTVKEKQAIATLNQYQDPENLEFQRLAIEALDLSSKESQLKEKRKAIEAGFSLNEEYSSTDVSSSRSYSVGDISSLLSDTESNLSRSPSVSSLNSLSSDKDLLWDNTGDIGASHSAEYSCSTPKPSSYVSDKNLSEKLARLRVYQKVKIDRKKELEQLLSTSSEADQIAQQIEEVKKGEEIIRKTIDTYLANPSMLNDVSFEEIDENLKQLGAGIPESVMYVLESEAQEDPEAILDGSTLQKMLSSNNDTTIDSLPSGDEEQEDTEVTESGIQKAGDKGLLALPVSSNDYALALSDCREKECLALGDGSKDEEDDEGYNSGSEEEEETIEQLSDSDGGNLETTAIDTAISLEQEAKKEMQTQISENAPTLNQAKVVNSIVNNMIRNRLDASINMSNNMVAVGAGDEEEVRIKRGLWVRGMYGINNHGRVENINGYRGTNKGATIGFDVEIDNNIVGIAYSNVHSVFKFKNSKNNDKEIIDSHVVSIYGQKELPKDFALQALVSASKNFIKDKTTYSYGDNKIRSNVKHRNHSYNAEALLNYNYLVKNNLVITPNIGLRYGKSRDGVYNETGINVQEIALTMKENNILSGIVGTKVKVPLKDALKFNNLGLTFQGAVEHNFKEKTQRINRVVKIFDTEFKQNYAIPKQPKTSYNLGTGIMGSIKNTTISLDYNYYLNKHYRSHQGSVKLKVNL